VVINRARGFTLIELLLVLVCIAVVIGFSLSRYRDYHQQAQIAGVKNDVTRIQQALNRYYHTEGCRSDGQFAGELSPQLSALGLRLKARAPIVSTSANEYAAEIVKVHKQSTDGRPVYALQVRVKLNPTYSDKKMRWYQKKLGAEALLGQSLLWTSLPGNTAIAPGTKLWMMKPEGEQFRRMENKMRLQETTTRSVSSSYCAH